MTGIHFVQAARVISRTVLTSADVARLKDCFCIWCKLFRGRTL